LGNFFLDDLFRFEAVILVPSPALQQKLADAVAAGWPRRLHQPAYSAESVLDFAAAIDSGATRTVISLPEPRSPR